jgi:diguanylate cyclase (GGDEF)-like protein
MAMKKKTRSGGRGATKRGRRLSAMRKIPNPRRTAMAAPQTLASGREHARATIRQLRGELSRALKRIEELQASADTDFLLGIHNRRGFERELNRAVAYIRRYGASGALIVLDVDRLKTINDTFGHAAGDEILKAIAAVLTREVRASDALGRLGGDEFALLLWNLTTTDARAKAVSLEKAVDQLTFTFDGRNVGTGASAGIAMLDANVGASRALEEADRAMYVRKAQRRHELEATASQHGRGADHA